MNKKFTVTLLFFVLFPLTRVEAGIFYKEANLITGHSDNEKWVGRMDDMLKNSVGFEYYNKFSNDYGDFLTADFQARVSYDSLENRYDAWALEVHNAWLEYKLGLGSKLRVGHFDPAFGLEPTVDTHATLLQTLAMKNIGVKKDWGMAYKGILGNYDYEIAAQLGSGMSIYHRDDSFLTTARIGAPSQGNFQYGISFLYGNVLQTKGMRTFPRDDLLSPDAVLKKRVGLDGQYLWGPYVFKTEMAVGRDERSDVLGYLGEIDYTFPKFTNLEAEVQFQSWMHDLSTEGSDDSTATIGLTYKLNASWTARTAYRHDVNLMEGNEDEAIFLQFYYYGR